MKRTNTFINSLDLIKKNPVYFIFSCLIDIGFVFILLFVYQFFFEKIMDNFINLLMMTGRTFYGLAQESLESSILMQQMNSSINNIVWWIIGLIISVYFIYSIFQSASWFFAGKTVDKKLIFWDYIKRFFAVNAVWHIILTVIMYFYVRSVILTNTFKISSGLDVIETSSFIFIIILSYFSLISYALIAKLSFRESMKKCFIEGFKRFFSLLPFFVVFALVFLFIDLILKLIFLINDTLMFIAGLIIILPTITYFRVVLISIIKDFSR